MVEEPIAEEPVIEEPQEVDTLLENDGSNEVSDEITEENEEDFDDEETSSSAKTWLLVVAACLVGLIAGYFVGNHFPLSSLMGNKQEPVEVAKTPVEATPSKPVVADQQLQEDSLEVVVPEKEIPTTEKEPAKVTSEETPIKETAPASAASLKEMNDNYGAKDSRVRTGAYRIVGTDKVVKALAGDNVAKVSRRYLGQGMECYVEVYNDLTASSVLTAGQEIKIPKLEIKKKKKVQN